MSSYVVTFFKHLLSSDGHIFKSPQQSFEIRHAKSIERAAQAAGRRYERLCKLAPWTLHADTLEVEIDGQKVDHSTPVSKSTDLDRRVFIAALTSRISIRSLGNRRLLIA